MFSHCLTARREQGLSNQQIIFSLSVLLKTNKVFFFLSTDMLTIKNGTTFSKTVREKGLLLTNEGGMEFPDFSSMA